jgi:branched-chain amino acid transport system permease protein
MMFLEYSLIGLASGGIYGLVALGFVFIYLASGVFNFATGEMMMMGAYFFFSFASIDGVQWWQAFIMAFAASILLAILIERFLIRRLIGQPVVATIMVTLGLGWILRGLANLIWGPVPKQLPNVLPRAPVFIGEILIPGRSFWGFWIAISIALLSILYFRYSRGGVALRATASDQLTAYSMGIDVRASVRLTWILAAVAATLAGCLMGSINSVTPELANVAVNVLAVVMMGGVNSVVGVVIAGILLGWIEAITGVYLGGDWRDVIPYIAVLTVLLVRPYGLFGTRAVERI